MNVISNPDNYNYFCIMNTLHTFTYKDCNISYTDTNNQDDTLVLLHGFLGNKEQWSPYIQELCISKRVICVDLLGHGASDCLGYVHTMEDQADVIYSLLQSLRIKKCSIAGHSMGGYVTLSFANLYPEMCEALFLINSTAKEDSDLRKMNRKRAIDAVKKNKDLFVNIAVNNLFTTSVKTNFPLEFEQTKAAASNTSTQGVIASLEGMRIRENLERMYYQEEILIHLLLSTEDTVIPYFETIAEANHTEVFITHTTGGHMSFIEQKQKTLDFLKSNVSN